MATGNGTIHDEARRVLSECWREIFEVPRTIFTVDKAVDALAAAGLLVTPEMLELCEAAMEANAYGPVPPSFSSERRLEAACIAYRATLKPKERWTVRRGTTDTSGNISYDVIEDGCWRATFDRKAMADAYAAQRNREEAKP